MSKYKAGTKIKRKGHISITILEVLTTHYRCCDTDTPEDVMVLDQRLLDEGWTIVNPIWLKYA